MPCDTCHTAITRRSDFGDAFRRHGYRWPGDPAGDARARKPAPLEMAGVGLGAAQFPLVWPFSAASSFGATYDPDGDPALNLGNPAINFLFGSALGEQISVFGTWSGSGVPNEAFLHLRPIGRPEWMLRIGRLEQNTSLLKNNEALMGSWLLASSPLNGHSVGQGRLGAEASGIVGGRGFYAAGIVRNGNVGDSYNHYYQVGGRLFGMDLNGEEPEVDLDQPRITDNLSLTVNHWGYFGDSVDASGEPVAHLARLGADVKLGLDPFAIWAGLMYGRDRDLLLDRDNHSLTGLAELTFDIRTWLLAVYHYQLQDAASLKSMDQIHGLGLLALLYENVRLTLRYSRSTGASATRVDADTGEVRAADAVQAGELKFLVAF